MAFVPTKAPLTLRPFFIAQQDCASGQEFLGSQVVPSGSPGNVEWNPARNTARAPQSGHSSVLAVGSSSACHSSGNSRTMPYNAMDTSSLPVAFSASCRIAGNADFIFLSGYVISTTIRRCAVTYAAGSSSGLILPPCTRFGITPGTSGKHLSGVKPEVDGTFVQSGKNRKRRGEWKLVNGRPLRPVLAGVGSGAFGARTPRDRKSRARTSVITSKAANGYQFKST